MVNVNGLRIAGLSGIYKGYNYQRGHFETAPFNQDTLRSVYHVREYEVFKLLQISTPLDIVMSHDWPQGIYAYGKQEDLFMKKKFLRKEVPFCLQDLYLD